MEEKRISESFFFELSEKISNSNAELFVAAMIILRLTALIILCPKYIMGAVVFPGFSSTGYPTIPQIFEAQSEAQNYGYAASQIHVTTNADPSYVTEDLSDEELLNLGNCECDLSANSCDINCCCDSSDCTSSQLGSFTCVNEGVSTAIEYCVDASEISTVNSDGYIASNSKATSFEKEILCVSKQNRPTIDELLVSPGNIGNELVSQIISDKAYSFTEQTDPYNFGRSSSATYSIGQPIFANLLDSSGSYVSGGAGGYFFVSRAGGGSGGLCNEFNHIMYGIDIELSSCTRIMSNSLQSLCQPGTSLDGSKLAGTSGPRLATNPTKSSFIPTTGGIPLISLKYREPATRTVISFSPTPSAVPSPVWSDNACHYVPVEVKYEIVHDGEGILLNNLAAEITLSTIFSLNDSNPFAVDFSSSVKFYSSADEKLEFRQRSGNPGYIIGSPVVAGVEEGSASTLAINQLIHGLQMPSQGAGGICSLGSSQEILFGVNSQSTCVTYMTLAELTSFCNSNEISIYGAHPFGNATHVGSFGNAHWANMWEWIELGKGSSVTTLPTRTWNGASFTCSNAVQKILYNFVVGDVGSLSNPQPRIIGATIEYQTGNIVFPNPTSSSALPISLTTVVTFSTSSSGLSTESFDLPSPPILPEIPSDFFYPFLTSGSSPRTRAENFIFLSAIALSLRIF